MPDLYFTTSPDRDDAYKVGDQVEVGPGYGILEVTAPPALCGKSLVQSNIRAQYGVTVIAIKPGGTGRNTVVAPPADTIIADGDVLVVIGTEADIDRFHRMTP